jgi:hypothetical protein
VERAVSEQVLRALEPAALQRAVERETTLHTEWLKQHEARELALEQARYEAARIFRQYNAVEPENRLVGAELERRLERAMEDVHRQERELALLPCPAPPTEEQQRLLRWLGGQFTVVWNHPEADAHLKKRIMRCLIREILVDVSEEDRFIQGVIHWQGGGHTELRLPKRSTGQHRFTTDHQVIELIRSLARVCPDRSIASILNRLGFTTGRGNGWTESRVRSARSYHGIPNFDPMRRPGSDG